jgi:hypothetical protein
MLFCYPVTATGENWLHESLVEIVRSALEAMNAGNPPSAWPNCIPAPYRARIRTRSGLQTRLKAFCRAAQQLDNAGRAQILDAVSAENNHPAIFDAQSPCPSIFELPETIRQPALELFTFAFGLLTPLRLRDRQYQLIHSLIADKVCPFCGCEYFDAPGAPRHHLDHYLAISRYPFAGSNLRNLVPMGDRCNAAFKRDIDILLDGEGQRRRCFDPYGDLYGGLSLMESRPFEGQDGAMPDWNVDLGQSPESQTWDEVWEIKTRYKRDVLDQEYRHWLEHFAQWCRVSGRVPTNGAEIIQVLDDYLGAIIQEGFADRAFLKKAVFEMLKDKISTGPYSERLSHFLIIVVSPDVGAGA